MTPPRRAVKLGLNTAVLLALAAGTGAVVLADPAPSATAAHANGALEGEAAAAQGSAGTDTTSADIPLLNTTLAADDVVHVTPDPASRGSARTALADGDAVTFAVVVDGETREITTAADTLADALAESGIELGWDDTVSVDLTTQPQAGEQVTIGRGTIEYVTEQTTTPHAVEQRETDSLALGETQVVQEGVDGVAQTTSQVTKVDGVETARTTLVSTQLTAAVPEIVEVGTKTTASTKLYTLSEFMSAGVVNWNGYKFTYYSQSVLPGGGLVIPGRHVNADGYVADADGYIVLASSTPKGTVIDTPFGAQGKVYDRGTVGNHFDVYTR